MQLQNGDCLTATLLGIIEVIKDASCNYTGNYFGNVKHLVSVIVDIVEMPDQTIYAAMPGLGLKEMQSLGNSYKLLNIF